MHRKRRVKFPCILLTERWYASLFQTIHNSERNTFCTTPQLLNQMKCPRQKYNKMPFAGMCAYGRFVAWLIRCFGVNVINIHSLDTAKIARIPHVKRCSFMFGYFIVKTNWVVFHLHFRVDTICCFPESLLTMAANNDFGPSYSKIDTLYNECLMFWCIWRQYP